MSHSCRPRIFITITSREFDSREVRNKIFQYTASVNIATNSGSQRLPLTKLITNIKLAEEAISKLTLNIPLENVDDVIAHLRDINPIKFTKRDRYIVILRESKPNQKIQSQINRMMAYVVKAIRERIDVIVIMKTSVSVDRDRLYRHTLNTAVFELKANQGDIINIFAATMARASRNVAPILHLLQEASHGKIHIRFWLLEALQMFTTERQEDGHLLLTALKPTATDVGNRKAAIKNQLDPSTCEQWKGFITEFKKVSLVYPKQVS